MAYAKANDLIGPDPAAFVVGAGVAAQTDELARASTVDLTYRAAASVSRNERRTAIAASGARDAKELEAKQKVEAARKAKEAKAAAERAEREKARKAAIDNAKENPKAAARVLMVDQGWTSNAQYNCLVNLWTGESDWRWWAENSSSGAYGIPQSLPARKMAQMGADYRTNPITQIKWGLWYIKMSYGTPLRRLVVLAVEEPPLVLTHGRLHGRPRPACAPVRPPARARVPQILRRRTRVTSWFSPLESTSVARDRVGRMFSTRLGPLISRQIRLAVATASSSDSTAYRWK